MHDAHRAMRRTADFRPEPRSDFAHMAVRIFDIAELRDGNRKSETHQVRPAVPIPITVFFFFLYTLFPSTVQIRGRGLVDYGHRRHLFHAHANHVRLEIVGGHQRAPGPHLANGPRQNVLGHRHAVVLHRRHITAPDLAKQRVQTNHIDARPTDFLRQ